MESQGLQRVQARARKYIWQQEMLPALCLGIDTRFKGQYLHSREYKDVEAFRGKRVLVVGIGNTGGDLAVELSHVAAKVQLRGCAKPSQGPRELVAWGMHRKLCPPGFSINSTSN